jgi:hypothetical protein
MQIMVLPTVYTTSNGSGKHPISVCGTKELSDISKSSRLVMSRAYLYYGFHLTCCFEIGVTNSIRFITVRNINQIVCQKKRKKKLNPCTGPPMNETKTFLYTASKRGEIIVQYQRIEKTGGVGEQTPPISVKTHGR